MILSLQAILHHYFIDIVLYLPLSLLEGIGGSSLFFSAFFFPQQIYIHDLIQKFHLHTAKAIRTRLPCRTTLSHTDGDLCVDSSEYCSMVGALQYLTMTLPDHSYVVHLVAQFMQAPQTTHLADVKRIFKYFIIITDHGLWLRPSRDITIYHCLLRY